MRKGDKLQIGKTTMEVPPMIELRAGSATDVGLVRTNNQDELLVADPLFAVADGMGGPPPARWPRRPPSRALQEAFAAAGEPTADNLIEAAQAANRAVWDQAEANPEMRGMGTTLVALALVEDGRLAVINVGRLPAVPASTTTSWTRSPPTTTWWRSWWPRAGCPRRRPSSTRGATS